MTSRAALIVGINQYPQLNSLRLPATDAEAIAGLLEEQGDFRITRIPEVIVNERLQVGQNTQVTVTQLEDALVQLFKPDHRQAPDVALFYFAGHGIRKHKGLDDGYLATSDTNLNNVWGLSLHWLRRLLQESPVKSQIVWLDCCYSGALLDFNEADPGDKGLARDRCFIAASGAFEAAYEEVAGDHGVLTQALLQTLDCSHKDQVTGDDLIASIKSRLKTSTQEPKAFSSGSTIVLTFNRQHAPVAAVSNPIQPCPYKGLFYFDCAQEDAQNFFGRERLTDDLLAKIRKDNFIAVLGASGSGKSSVVRAGLLYQLQAGRKIAGSGQWRQQIMTPTDQPIHSLAKTFVDHTAPHIEQARQLQAAIELIETKGVTGFEALLLSANTKVVLFIDQFEELFTLCSNDHIRQQFLATVLPALSRLPDRLRLIITLRADFFARCTEQDAGLAQLIQNHLVAITPLAETELTAAIVKPAERLGITIAPDLLKTIRQDAQQCQGYMPLLQEVLSQLWELGMNVANYNALNGLVGALEKRADAIYHNLSPTQQSAAQAIFLSLVQLGDGSQDTRRRAVKSSLISQQHSAELIDSVLLPLADAHLIVTDALNQRSANGVSSVTVIDIAHEALIQHWTLLRQWLNENREFKAWRDGLALAEQDYQHNNHDQDLLLRGSKLVAAEEHLQQAKARLNQKEIYFIEASLEEKARQVHALNKRRQLLLAGLIGFSVIVSSLAILSFWQYQEAEQQTHRAQQQKDLALAVINRFTYDVPEALANIPKTAALTAEILDYNIQALDKIHALNPLDNTALREKASNYSRVGKLYLTLLGNAEKALQYYRQDLQISQQFAQQNPKDQEAQRDLSISLEGIADATLRSGDAQQALAYYQQATTISQQLSRHNPNSREAQHDLSISYNNLADVSMQLGDTEKAAEYYQLALKICTQLAQADPNNKDAQRDLSASFDRLANVALRLGDTQKALDNYQLALTIREQLAQDLQNLEAQRDLSVSFIKLADVSLQIGDHETAIDNYQQALGIRQQLAQQDPQNSAAQRDLSVSHVKLADVQLRLGDTQQASDNYQLALKIRTQIVRQDPQNSNAQRDLSISLNKLADVSMQLGDIPKALENYQLALTTRQQIAKQDRHNDSAQRDLSVSYDRLANVYNRLGDTQKALDNYQLALKIREQLAQEDPQNNKAQRDLLVSYDKLGLLHKRLKQSVPAITYLNQALAIAEQLARDKINQQAQQDLKTVQKELAGLKL